MRVSSMAALATVLATFASTDLISKAEAHGIGHIGGMHIGGLGHIGGFHGFHGGGFHGGFHGGNFHSGNFHSGGFQGGGMQAGGYGGGAAYGGARPVGGAVGTNQAGQGLAGSQSFASRYRVNAVGSNFGSGMTASKNVAAAGGKSNVVQAAHTASVPSNGAAAKSGSNLNNLASGTGNLVPRKGSTGILFGGLGLYGPGFGYGYGGFGGNGYGPYGYSYCSYYGLPDSNNLNSAAIPSGPPAPPIVLPSGGGPLDFSALAETQFKAGNYAAAVSAWRHALLDESKSPVLVLLYAQGLFAIGKFDEAAGAVQQALRQLPDDKWGVVVTHYLELYRGNQDYTDQLRRALELARNNPATDSPAVRFLLGYHYGYLGYPKHAVAELDKTLTIVADDSIAKQLRDMMAAKQPAASEVTPPAKPTAK